MSDMVVLALLTFQMPCLLLLPSSRIPFMPYEEYGLDSKIGSARRCSLFLCHTGQIDCENPALAYDKQLLLTRLFTPLGGRGGWVRQRTRHPTISSLGAVTAFSSIEVSN